MDTNPYKRPEAPPEPAHPINTIWWKLYFWLAAALTILSLLGMPSAEGFTVFDYVDFILSATALVGLYGFAYYERIGSVVFWRYFFYVALVESVFFSGILPAVGAKRFGQETTIDAYYLLEIALAVLMLAAIYRYAYWRPFIWNRS
jgi:hypothetical protein